MKRKLILSLLLFTCSFAGKAQNKTYSLDSIYNVTWHIKSFSFNGQTIEHTEEQKKNNWMVFQKDGKHKVKTRGKLSNGTWQYDAENSTFTFKDKGNITKQKIIKLTAKELILEGGLDGKKLIIHLQR